MYPNREQFRDLLITRDPDWIIDTHLFRGQPFYSSGQPEVHDRMITALSVGLCVPKHDICVVGSGRIGFSLSPDRFGEPFGQFSDIDVIVVSASLFDPSWLDILGKRQARVAALDQQTRRQLTAHRDGHFIYNGWIYPATVVRALAIGRQWLTTFNRLSQITALSGRSIGGRLYRTWDHARVYHRWSLNQVKRRLLL